MLQIIIQGRGGQGAQTAGQLLAMAFFAQGKQVQCFASYGGARRGTPRIRLCEAVDRSSLPTGRSSGNCWKIGSCNLASLREAPDQS